MPQTDSHSPHRILGQRVKPLLTCIAGGVVCYLLLSYVAIPLAWKGYTHRHPSFDADPRVTRTSDGHPGDPLNVALIGTEAQLTAIMALADWSPADALSLHSDLKIAADTVLERPYAEAPVSSLYLFGRKEDFAFERAVGNNPRQRNHVRFWKRSTADADGRPIWIGSASFDERVGLSETTGEITHHIAPDIDLERDRLFADLVQTKMLAESYPIHDFHQIREGRNGGGDRWTTDGDLSVGVIDNR